MVNGLVAHAHARFGSAMASNVILSTFCPISRQSEKRESTMKRERQIIHCNGGSDKLYGVFIASEILFRQ